MWADDPANWTGTVNSTASNLNTTAKTYTFSVDEVNYVWSYAGSTVGSGSPAVSIGNSDNKSCIKMGSSKSIYFNPVIFSTDAFTNKAVTKVNVYLKHNGKKVGNLTVKQGTTTIGTATTSESSDWINVTCSQTKKGAGGTLEIKYEVAQAIYINKIEVWYEDLGKATTTTIDASGITNTDVYTSTAAGSLSASVKEKDAGTAVAGATISWTSSNENVAPIASDGTVTLKKRGSTTITASYEGNSTYAASSAEYVLTVTNSAPQVTDIDADFNNVFLGVTAGSRISEKTTVTVENVDFVFDKPSGSNWPQGDAGVIRMYDGTTLQIVAPAGYSISNITFTANGDWKSGMDADAGTYDDTLDDDNKTYWTGTANSVTFTPKGTHRIASVSLKLVASKDIIITAATWASFSCDKALDFTNTDVKAYIAKAKDDSNVTLTEIKKVPASTGIVVNAPAGTYPIPVLSGDADETTGNLLKPWLTAGTPTESKYYTLAVDNDKKPVFKVSSGGTLAAGKSYLVVSGTDAPTLAVDFGETTGVNTLNVERGTLNGEVYNLNGQRVAQPTKGLYIVNGKKVLIK